MKRAPRRRTKAGAAVDIVVKSPLWTIRRGIKTVLRRAVAEAPSATEQAGELAIVLTYDESIRALSRDWRRQDQPTNVLSFPAKEPRAARGTPRLLGDIVIAYETTEREARAEHKPFAHHLAHLAVHGFLHLVGYDHAADVEADAMEGLETAILARLDVPDPYLARSTGA